MNLKELRQELLLLVDDEGFADVADSYINQALSRVASEVPLRSLKGLGTVQTIVNSNALNLAILPDFSKLVTVYSPAGKVTQFGSLQELLDKYQENGAFPDRAGDVEAVAQEGTVLWYQDVPTAVQTLSVVYYKSPPALVADTDIPVDIPLALQRTLLVHGAAIELFSMIEDGVEQNKVNAANSEYQFNKGLIRLREWQGERTVHKTTSAWTV